MHPKTRIRAFALFCISLVAIVPAGAWPGAGGHRGCRQPAIGGNVGMGTRPAADCPCADDGTFWQFQSGDNRRNRSCVGNHVCDTTYRRLLARQ